MPAYYNPQNMNERVGLPPKQAAQKIFTHFRTGSLPEAQGPSTQKEKKNRVTLKHFTRPGQTDIDKCQVYLHNSMQEARKKKHV